MDRRNFFALGAISAGYAATQSVNAATLPETRTVRDFGVEPGRETDQTAALQAAIAAMSNEGSPVVIPAGVYRIAGARVLGPCAIIGVPGYTKLVSKPGMPVFTMSGVTSLTFRDLTFEGCGIEAVNCRNVSVFDCDIASSGNDGLFLGGTGLMVSRNRVSNCATSGIRIEGDGIVTENLIGGPGQYGLSIGGKLKLGTISVVNNRIGGVAVGIGVSNADGGYALIAMNMISGAKSGGIRALNGDTLTGPDLTKSSAESFRNLAIAANVSI